MSRDYIGLNSSRRIVEWRMKHRSRDPRTFNDRLVFKMVHDRRPMLTHVADKVLAREYISSIVGGDQLAMCMAVASAPEEIDWEELPREHVVKVNHGSGGIVMITDDAEEDAHLPTVGSRVGWARFRVKPENAHPDRIMDLCRHWLTLNYSWARGRPTVQWCYQDIAPRILVEELLRDVRGCHPQEYRIFVINGSVAFAQAEIDTFGDHRTAVMSPEWEMLPVKFMDPPPDEAPAQPDRWPEMVGLAESLARPIIDFVRVDMYDLGDRIVVGELTHYPSGGTAPISSRELALAWGRDWAIPY